MTEIEVQIAELEIKRQSLLAQKQAEDDARAVEAASEARTQHAANVERANKLLTEARKLAKQVDENLRKTASLLQQREVLAAEAKRLVGSSWHAGNIPWHRQTIVSAFHAAGLTRFLGLPARSAIPLAEHDGRHLARVKEADHGA